MPKDRVYMYCVISVLVDFVHSKSAEYCLAKKCMFNIIEGLFVFLFVELKC